MGIIFNKVFVKMLGIPSESDDAINKYENALDQNLKFIENYYLKESEYLANNQLSGFSKILLLILFYL